MIVLPGCRKNSIKSYDQEHQVKIRLTWLFVLLTVLLSACNGSSDARISVLDPWVRAAVMLGDSSSAMTDQSGSMAMATTPESERNVDDMAGISGTNSAAYMIIKNAGGQADRLLSVESDVAASVEIHLSEMNDGVMSMRPVEGIDIPAGGQAELKPGSYHVMLVGIKHDLKEGDKVQLKLNFEKSAPVTVEAQVRNP
jgi:periplasmic copper chaperone A